MFKTSIVTVLLICSAAPVVSKNAISTIDYVTGKFSPEKNTEFINLKKTGIKYAGSGMFLRKEASQALEKLISDFNKEHPKIVIRVISAARNFEIQKKIWSDKWTGKRKVTGIKNINDIKSPVEKARTILNYSSMPGTSRHHWGTDFDMNSLDNKYFEKGEGKIVYDWFIKNARRYGFGQPYTAGRKDGYKEEKWHWSYTPLSSKYLKIWNDEYSKNKKNFSRKLTFPGSKEALFLAPIYVNSINDSCK